MNIFVLTPLYSDTTTSAGATPVVHYFTKEWIKLGHSVTVFHLQAVYPSVLYNVARKFQHELNNALGMLVPIQKPLNYHTCVDGVEVYGLTYRKYIPHTRISRYQTTKIVNFISQQIEHRGEPDVIVAHWLNPSLKLLIALKSEFSCKTAIILHNNNFSSFAKTDILELKQIDTIGFRNVTALQLFKQTYNPISKLFVAHSGVSCDFISAGNHFVPTLDNGINRYIFVGSLIRRKHPVAIIQALVQLDDQQESTVTFIGDGSERGHIEENALNAKCPIAVNFTGRIPRHEIVAKLKEHQVFIMISEHEVFGLVYLEAMALGLITIASLAGGVDGIIVDGQNGFLCEPGNYKELARTIKRIKSMSPDDLINISNNAKKTAQQFTDCAVAKQYLCTVI